MSAHEQRDPDKLEAVLKSLKPAAPGFDRDGLMFRAGQAAHRAAGWRVSMLTALAGVLVGTMGTWLTVRAVWQPEERVQYVYVTVPELAPVPPVSPEQPKQKDSPKTPPAPPEKEWTASAPWPWFPGQGKPAGGYLHLRDQVLRWGVDMLPSATPVSFEKQPAAPSSLWQMQSEFLENMGGI